MLSLRPLPDPIPLNQQFRFLVDVLDPATLRRLDGERIQVNAWMPDHGHDMNRRPRVTQLEDGSFVAEGMLFFMRGRWQVQVNVFHGRASGQALVDYEVGELPEG